MVQHRWPEGKPWKALRNVKTGARVQTETTGSIPGIVERFCSGISAPRCPHAVQKTACQTRRGKPRRSVVTGGDGGFRSEFLRAPQRAARRIPRDAWTERRAWLS